MGGENPDQKAPGQKAKKYTRSEMLSIYKELGNFQCPTENPERYSIKHENLEILRKLVNPAANVVLKCMNSEA